LRVDFHFQGMPACSYAALFQRAHFAYNVG
jgi:hypothetical protein